MQTFLNQTWQLLRKDMRLEYRQRYALGGILLYVLSTVFVVYATLGQEVGGAVWAALFWIIVLFASVNAIAKSFVQEGSERQLYYYFLASPSAIIAAKIAYNTLLLLVVSFLALGVFSVVLGFPVKHVSLFMWIVFWGSLGFSIAFTFISAIAAKAQQSATLMAVLSFPVVIPILLMLLRLSKIAIGLMTDTAYMRDFVILVSVDAILLAMVFLLFPLLWRD